MSFFIANYRRLKMSRRYIISDAAEKTGLEPHVLRYWEDELGIDIPRNEMGHRYYLEEHIELFKKIKVLKEQKIALKVIKNMVKDELVINEVSEVKDSSVAINMPKAVPDDAKSISQQVDKQTGDLIMFRSRECEVKKEADISVDKMAQFERIIGNILSNALKENNTYMQQTISENVSDKVIKQMDYMFRVKEDAEEERYKKFDEMLRNCVNNVNDNVSKNEKKRRRLFRK